MVNTITAFLLNTKFTVVIVELKHNVNRILVFVQCATAIASSVLCIHITMILTFQLQVEHSLLDSDLYLT